MELPSMVQRSGDTLIVRSVVSGNQLYMDQGANSGNSSTSNNSNLNVAHYNSGAAGSNTATTSALEQHLERFRAAHHHQQQQHYLQQQQQSAATTQQQQASALELKDEGLPQCKIKRNYSCSYCTYFTQNPRYHLTHLRDVHGEKIVINKCQLCLYASRHFQKLVRHMKMVHGCTDGVVGGAHGQARGKRGMSREARKRKLEQSVGLGVSPASMGGGGGGGSEMPTLEQVKRELALQEQKLQRDMQAFSKLQEEQKHQQQLANNAAAEAIFAYGCQLQRERERERELEVLQAARTAAATNERSSADTTDAAISIDAQRHQASPLNGGSGFQVLSAAQQQRSMLDLTPSPTGSASPTPNSASIAPAAHANYQDEPPQNRLLKCSICEYTTLYRHQLLEHEIDVHCKTKFFRCEKCSYVTHIKARFSKHVKYHSMPMIKCVTCDFRTPYKWNLDRHMKNHGGAGPFKCAACDFTADIKQSLTVHEMNHHVPPVGHAAGMSLARRRNKVGGTDLCDDFLSDSADLLEDHYNNNNMDDDDDALVVGGVIDDGAEAYGKRSRYGEDEPTDLSQKGGSSDTSSVHNHSITPKAKRPVPNLIPIPKGGTSVLNLSKDLREAGSSLADIGSMFFSEKQLSEMLLPLQKTDAAQLSPTTTITSNSSHNSRLLSQKRATPSGSFFDRLKSSAITSGGPNENLICPCGHMAKCLSESIIHRKTCNYAAIADDDIEEEQDDTDDRLEIDFADEDDKQSHSALNLSVTGSTRCQHCRHRCKSSADLLNHLKQCTEAGRCGNESFDSLSGESSAGRLAGDMSAEQQHPMENRVFIWNKITVGGSGVGAREGSQCSEGAPGGNSGADSTAGGGSGSNEENSYYGVETAPGYGEVTKKMTPEEEAANSSLKKVYKCPHCSFWASTASRFHVHIVGHLNKKPFECSLCSYRSNWRWDITKHIRLKTIRDPSHKNARVLMNDETGRRNYTKYNKYITLMKVTEEDGDPKLMKSGEMTPNQVASLAFLNDLNKNASVGSIATGANLNGLKDDVTLEPVGPAKAAANAEGGEGQLSDGFMRLPLLATMMMQQQQKEQDQQQQHTTLITPSVTISAVKRSPPPLMKPSDDLVTDVKQEGNEKKTYHKCRKCSFRHTNRDAVLAHVKVHYQDANYPIVSATATSSPKSSNPQQQQSHATPLQVSVNTNHYMNKMLAAMCLSQQQQNSNASAANHSQQQQHSILSAGLLQQAIQGASQNPALSGLALALAGKNQAAAKAATASILEHGEQKASQNEASAQAPAASPTNQKLAASSASTPATGANPPSLQHLLTSPRGTYPATSSMHYHHHHQHNQQQLHEKSPSATGVGGSGAPTNNSNSNTSNNMVMGELLAATSRTFKSPSTAATPQPHQQAAPAPSPSPTSATASIVTTLATTTTTSTSNPSATTNNYMGIIGGATTAASSTSASSTHINSSSNCGDSICIGGVLYGSNTSTLNCNNLSTSATTSSTSITPTTSTTISSNMLLNSAQTNASSSSLSSPSSSSTPPSATNFNNNNSLLNNSNSNININMNNPSNILSNDSERRDPSPYRCGHCHQLSNWKHVIQRHCRLKHAGDIRIETLDRTALGTERNPAPVYRPLGNGASNESNYGLTLKALQQQQQPNHNSSTISSNNNSVLMNKSEHLMHSPLAGTAAAAANAASTPQDMQTAAAAFLTAAYKAATGNVAGIPEDLLLQQQLQHNDQIEITRLPASSAHSSNSPVAQQQNSKCKQQKCPLCPYISESKSQMNYHISLHKPTQYECSLCTFVCAKKQHLSSHMRSVHQQHSGVAAALGVAGAAGSGGGLNLDFSVALQWAAAAQAQQDSSALPSPLAIDLTALKHTLSAAGHQAQLAAKGNGQQHQQLQQLMAPSGLSSKEVPHSNGNICYCPKCPARFAQGARHELGEHLKCHEAPPTAYSGSNKPSFKCEFCDFHAAHETHIQTHRHVHSQHYQDKCKELHKLCKEDPEYMAPKLMQITLAKNLQTPETVWIVDSELSEQAKQQHHQQQHASISSSSNYEGGNSLLKKQLESGPVVAAATAARHTPSPKQTPTSTPTPAECEDSSSNTTPSTSASVATSDLAADPGSDTASMLASPTPPERCQHCPYETKNNALFKAHLQHHICIANQKETHTCEHCDYTDADQQLVEEHTRVHFNAMEKLKSVAFFTSYDKLELSVEQPANEAAEDKHEEDRQGEEQAGGMALKANNCNIKQELVQEQNNNNEEHVVNENTVREEKTKAKTLSSSEKAPKEQLQQEKTSNLPKVSAKAPLSTTEGGGGIKKIILYKNDGHLSIKRDSNCASGDNISDRLRRRISRSSNSLLNGGSSMDEQQQQQQQSHKTILVNAKTGQVISRN